MTIHLLEEFIDVDCPFDTVEVVMTREDLMRRWMSPAVQFVPLDGWRFDAGARWQLQLTGLGALAAADYVVQERRPGLVLWSFSGFWEGFDAWHWWPDPRDPQRRTMIQNRIEYTLSSPLIKTIWPPIGQLMGLDAKVQMRRLQDVCERQLEPQATPASIFDLEALNRTIMNA